MSSAESKTSGGKRTENNRQGGIQNQRNGEGGGCTTTHHMHIKNVINQ